MTTIAKLWARYGAPYLKAHSAGLGVGLALLAEDCNWNLANFSHLTLDQWGGAVAASGLLGSFVGFIRNRPVPTPAATVPPAPTAAPAAAAQDVAA